MDNVTQFPGMPKLNTYTSGYIYYPAPTSPVYHLKIRSVQNGWIVTDLLGNEHVFNVLEDMTAYVAKELGKETK